MRKEVWPSWSITHRVVPARIPFAAAPSRPQVVEVLHQGPQAEARNPAAVRTRADPPSRWTLAGIGRSIRELGGYGVSGIWRVLQRLDLGLRTATVQQYSPDPEYQQKLQRVEECLRETAADPAQIQSLFLDQMGFTRWPEPAPDWGPLAPAEAPVAERQKSPQRLWRIVGALNAHSGRVDYLDGYIVGREKMIQFYGQLAQKYRQARKVYLIQDNWSIHRHPEVLTALAAYPQLQPVWLPTYAPWTNPIEKLWRLARQEVLLLHRLAGNWEGLLARVHGFFGRFAAGSRYLLGYVGLLGEGRYARILRGES
jgi:hypothetical protein